MQEGEITDIDGKHDMEQGEWGENDDNIPLGHDSAKPHRGGPKIHLRRTSHRTKRVIPHLDVSDSDRDAQCGGREYNVDKSE